MRVVHVNCYVDPDGRNPTDLLRAWPALTDVAAAVSREGVNVAVVQSGAQTLRLEHNGVQVHFVKEVNRSVLGRSPRRGQWAGTMPRRLAALVKRLAPDLIHFHSLSLPRHVGYLQRRLSSVPILVQDHADKVPPRWRRWIARRGFERIAAVAVTAREQAVAYRDAGVLRGNLPVFEILESSSWFRPGSQDAARQITGVHGNPCLLWVARLNQNKDPLMVIEGVSRAGTTLPNLHLWCCYGTTDLLEAVQRRLAADPQLESRVHLLGSVPHEMVEVLCRAADFFVLGSHAEGSCYAVLEAMACGLPVLVTDIPSFRRMTRNGAVGALVPPGDAEAMSRAIVQWAARNRDSLRTAVREHFQQYLSFDAIGTELRAAYDSVLGLK